MDEYRKCGDFCNRVTEQVRYATGRELDAIEEELMGHMEDRIEALLALGYPAEEAEQRAVAAMGDPEEVGRRLNREYPLTWLAIGRIALVLIVLVCCVLLTNNSWTSRVKDHITGRFFPETLCTEEKMLGYGCHETWETDIRAEIGNDVLRVYRVGLKNTEQGRRVCVALCGYDKKPLGRVNRNLLQSLWYIPEKGNRAHFGGSSGISAGLVYYTVNGIPVAEDAAEVVLVYDAYGEYAEIRVPLDGEVAA